MAAVVLLVCCHAKLEAPAAEKKSSAWLWDTWQAGDGLPQSSVSNLYKASDGALWLGVYDGLVRYDGRQFALFPMPGGGTLENEFWHTICEDEQGSLWGVVTDGSCYVLASGELRAVQAGTGIVLGKKPAVAQVGGEGLVVCAVEGELAELTSAGWKSVSLPQQLRERRVIGVWRCSPSALFALTEAGDLLQQERGTSWHLAGAFDTPILACGQDAGSGEFWVATKSELARWRGDSFEHFPLAEGNAPAAGTRLVPSSSGDVWMAAPAGWRRWASGEWRTGPVPNLPLDPQIAVAGSAGRLWLRGSAGLTTISPEGVAEQLGSDQGLASNRITALHLGTKDSIWVTMLGGGLQRIRPRYFSTFTQEQGLVSLPINTLAVDASGAVCGGSNEGGPLVRWNGSSFDVFGKSGLGPVPHSLLAEPDGSVLVGTGWHGLHRRTDSEVLPVPMPKGASSFVKALCRDRDGSLWVGTARGLWRMDGGRWSQFHIAEGLPHSNITALAPAAEGGVWVGTPVGAGRFHDGGWTPVTEKEPPGGSWVTCLLVDSSGALWIAVRGKGLFRVSKGRVESLRPDPEFSRNTILGLVEDDHGDLWIGTAGGLARLRARESASLPLAGATLAWFDRSDGLPTVQLSTGAPAICKDGAGRIWLATPKGIVRFHPSAFDAEAALLHAKIESVQADEGRLTFSDLVEIAPATRRIIIDYGAISLAAADKVRFRCQLRGLEREWQDVGKERSIVYPRPAPGRYEFHVIAANEDGLWSAEPAVLRFVVLQPWWEKTWIQLALLASFAAALVIAVRAVSHRRLRRSLAEARHRHALAEERARIARDIHDDVGARLTQLTMFTRFATRDLDAPPKAGAWLEKATVAARDALTAMDQIVWSVNPSNDTFERFADYVSNYSVEFLGGAGIDCHLDFGDEPRELRLPGPARHQLLMAVKEALRNIVKHAHASRVQISAAWSDGSLRIVIEDDGRGASEIPLDSMHNGIANMKQRLEKIGGTFHLEERACGGTRAVFDLPIPGGS
ncbi:MAG TPA: two-component regulator propeller domain-containing protein [Chthoniobacteraceae bacterium]|jgi:signal transduction histidine kinase/ligand-binding sensor domain-containing protein